MVRVMALLMNEMVKVPLEAAGAVGLMIKFVVTMQWHVVPAVMATVAEVVMVQVKAVVAVALTGELAATMKS